MNAFVAQCKAELRRTFRNKRFFIFVIGFPVMFYLIFTSTMGDLSVGGASFKSYYLMSMTAFGLVNASVNSLGVKMAQERSQGWVRWLKVTPLSSGAYVASKILSTLLVNLGIILMMFLIGHFAKGVQLSAAEWIGSGLWLLLGSLAFLALGALVGTTKKAEFAQVLATIFQLGFSLLGGLWTPVESFPKTLQDIASWMPTYSFAHGPWLIVAGLAIEWKNAGILAAYLILFLVLSSYLLKKQEAI